MTDSVNLGGARLFNSAGTGIEPSDIATKRYVDRWFHPLEDDRHFAELIKARDFLMNPLTGLCKVTTDMKIDGGNIRTLLESTCYSQTFFFHADPVQDKYIQVNYAIDVWVE